MIYIINNDKSPRKINISNNDNTDNVLMTIIINNDKILFVINDEALIWLYGHQRLFNL